MRLNFSIVGFVVVPEVRIGEGLAGTTSEVVRAAPADAGLDEGIDRGALNQAPPPPTTRAKDGATDEAVFPDQLVDESGAKPGILRRVSDRKPGGLQIWRHDVVVESRTIDRPIDAIQRNALL